MPPYFDKRRHLPLAAIVIIASTARLLLLMMMMLLLMRLIPCVRSSSGSYLALLQRLHSRYRIRWGKGDLPSSSPPGCSQKGARSLLLRCQELWLQMNNDCSDWCRRRESDDR